MADHPYLALDCKSPECDAITLLKYFGDYEEQPEDIIIEFPGDMELGCLRCGQIHFYKEQETRLVILPGPPPEGWKSVF